MKHLTIVVALLCSMSPAAAEDALVLHGRSIPLERFVCTDTPRSSFIRTVCYDADERYMLMKLRETWLQFCAISAETVEGLVSAESVGRFYHNFVENRFRCNVTPPPDYQ